MDDELTRRRFLSMLGASMALGGACTAKKARYIVAHERESPEASPGIPVEYATSMVLLGYATGLLVSTREGRPIKIEGNPDHPASLGGSGVFEQAALLQLYDPDRAATVRDRTSTRTWRALAEAIAPHDHGRGLHLLLEPTSSPLVVSLLGKLKQAYPEAAIHFFDPLAFRGSIEGSRAVFGEVVVPRHRIDRAEVVVSLDSSFLTEGPFHLVHARAFGRRRMQAALPRLWQVEAAFSPTGVAADHRVRLRSTDVARFGLALAAHVADRLGMPKLSRLTGAPAGDAAKAAAEDLIASRGKGLVIAGDRQPAATHAIAHLLNRWLGNAGNTVRYGTPPIFEYGAESHDLTTLVSALDRGEVDQLVILGGNPAYTAPADFRFEELIGAAKTSAYLGLYENETAAHTKWFAPESFFLEAWGDGRALDGTLSFIQPLIEPLHGGRSVPEVLALLLGESRTNGRDLLRRLYPKAEALEDGLESGFIRGSELPEIEVTASSERALPLFERIRESDGLELAFYADPRLYDGRFANNAWLQELPSPITQLVWENAAIVSPKTASELAIETDDLVAIRSDGRTIEAKTLVLSGQADGSIALHLGYGRSGKEHVAAGLGANAFAIRTHGAASFAPGQLTKLGRAARTERLAMTQDHHRLEGRAIALEAELDALDRDLLRKLNSPTPTVRADWPKEGRQWAMSIDLSACIGCGACVIACQSENNVRVVGKSEVLKNREMHWLRIDRYFTGPSDDPRAVTQPMACQHCERAPCEYVCPVNATTHSPDGLNEMVYNRCVGTRFCSNNCPYKVRRFNFLDHTHDLGELEQLAMNPDVTVRSRGVVEKCTYCVQRLRRAEIRSKVEGRPELAAEVTSACAQACPTGAIAFGDLSNPESEVSKRRRSERSYAVLNELGTEPRTRYLVRIRNSSPALLGKSREPIARGPK
jgi:Fe-S-cluster-containing dehydrogenase component